MFLKQPNINSPMTEVPIDLRHERVKGIDENLNIPWSLYLPRPIDSFCQNLELYLVNLIGNVTKIFSLCSFSCRGVFRTLSNQKQSPSGVLRKRCS